MNMHKHNIRYIILDPFRLNGVGYLRHCERLKGAWQSQEFCLRLLRQNLQFFLTMTNTLINLRINNIG
ncbi:hypothetical protein [Rickettsia helvetica]|uniref:hypothetical protein n=1 Tax=Rickettsia helvetica TaxID=35789 RepID=UPI0002E69FDB|nr:hypothetical protein [Rickettsia helvetica]MCZ6883989.1 hypothetical protein [Rickettsia endosymbiont of Ixodes ricinus]MCZ6896373.1 hypothetical protein [Rickettsia endosymbiont of Ixodes ricinus]